MNNIEKIHELLDMCLDIQSKGYGEEGYPFVTFCTANYGTEISIRVIDDGFKSRSYGYDGAYDFDFEHIGERTYQNCKQHLTDLKEKVNECITINAHTAEQT